MGTGSFAAVAFVQTNCRISTTPVAFGQYDPIVAHRSADLNATGAITVACVKGTAPTIALGAGANAAAGARRMRLAGESEFLDYQLYQPPTSQPAAPCAFPGARMWGAAGAEVFSASAAPSKTARTYNVCGTVRAGQNPRVGTYADIVIATVNF